MGADYILRPSPAAFAEGPANGVAFLMTQCKKITIS